MKAGLSIICAPSGRRNPGGAVQRGAVARRRGALPRRGRGTSPRTRARAWAGVRGRRHWPPRSREPRSSSPGSRSPATRWSRSPRSCSRRSRRVLAIRGAPVAATPARGARARSWPARSRTGCSTWTGRRESRVVLLDELAEVFELDLANLALIEDGGRRARLVAARDGGRDNERLVGQELDLENEPSGISTATREGAAFAVFDAESSPIVNQRLNQIARVKSCAFVPMLSGGEVVGVVFAAVRRPRLFGDEELAQMQTLAAEAGPRARAHARLRSARGGARARTAGRSHLPGGAVAARPRRAPLRRGRGDGEGDPRRSLLHPARRAGRADADGGRMACGGRRAARGRDAPAGREPRGA